MFKSFWPANSFYFITAKTFLSKKLFNDFYKKRIILEQIKEAVKLYSIPIFAYSIAQNHYHCLLYLDDYNKLKYFKQKVNGSSSFIYHRQFTQPLEEGKIWLDTKTLIIYNPESLQKVVGYISGNLIKHGEIKNFNELKACPFSSYRQLVERYGDDIAEDMVKSIIMIDEDDDFTFNLKSL